MNLAKTIFPVALLLLASCLGPAAQAQAQAAKVDADTRFHDDLLDRFVGRWDVTAVVHGANFTLQREAEWVLDHQYLRVHEKSREVIPWLKIPFERTVFIGYNHRLKHYVVYELTVHGADVPHSPEGLYFAKRTGDELSMDHMNGGAVIGRSVWAWDAAANTWHIYGSRLKDGKEERFLHQVAVAARAAGN